MTWIILKMHCGVAYESVLSLASGHVIRVCPDWLSCVLIECMTVIMVRMFLSG